MDSNYELDWENLKKTKQETIDVVFGYIRRDYENIPPLVQYTCLAFYRSSDQWDRGCIGVDYTLSEDNMTITHAEKLHSYSSAFCQQVVDKGKYEWRFLIKERAEPSKHWSILIGIWKTMINGRKQAPQINSYFTAYGTGDNGGAYAYVTDNACIVNKTGGGYGSKYGIMCKTGDIVQMFLDLDELTLSYSVNGIDQGVAYKIQPGSYRAALNTQYKGTIVEIQ